MTYYKKNIRINGVDISPGNNDQISLNWYQLPTKTVIEIPVYVFRSEKPGPTLLILAGMHGDEINGIEIVRRLITREDVKKPLCGSIIAIPVIRWSNSFRTEVTSNKWSSKMLFILHLV